MARTHSTVIKSSQFQPGAGSEIEGALSDLYSIADNYFNDVAYTRQWKRCRAAYMGDLYGSAFLDGPMPKWKAQGVHPKVNEIVESFAATLTDSEPKFIPKQRNDEDNPLARVFLECSDYEWERQKMQLKMEILARAMLIDGTTWLYTGIDPDGKMFTRNMSPFGVRIDPAAEHDEDMAYAVVSTTMSRSEIEAHWPDVAQEIFDTVTPSSGDTKTEEAFIGSPPSRNYGPMLGDIVNSGASQPTEIVSPQKWNGRRYVERYKVKEFWLTEGEQREIQLQLSDGSEKVIQLPGGRGRRIVMIEDRYFDALDMDNPFDHGHIPLSRFNAVTTLGEYYGYSYILPLIDTARQIADLDNQVLNNIRLMLNPIWLVPIESKVNPNKFFGTPNMVIPYRSGHEPTAHVAPPLPQYVFEQRRNKQQEFDVASGLADISRGIYSGGLDQVSGKAVQLLQQPEQRRMRPLLRSIEYGLARWGYQTLCNAAQSWPQSRWAEVLPADMQQIVPYLPWFQPQWQGPVDEWVPEIKMEAGSNLPPDTQQKSALAFNLYDKGAFGPPGSPEAILELMRGCDWPGAEQIASRVGQIQSTKPVGPDPVEKTKAVSALITALAAWAKAGEPVPLDVVDAALTEMGDPPWPAGNGAAPAPPPPAAGQNKALGGQRSPASDLAVMANPNGQEVSQ